MHDNIASHVTGMNLHHYLSQTDCIYIIYVVYHDVLTVMCSSWSFINCLLTVCVLMNSEEAEDVVWPLRSAEATAPQHHIERLCDMSNTSEIQKQKVIGVLFQGIIHLKDQTNSFWLTYHLHKHLTALLWMCLCMTASGSVWGSAALVSLLSHCLHRQNAACATGSHRVDDVFESMKARQHREDLLWAVCYFSKLRHNGRQNYLSLYTGHWSF